MWAGQKMNRSCVQMVLYLDIFSLVRIDACNLPSLSLPLPLPPSATHHSVYTQVNTGVYFAKSNAQTISFFNQVMLSFNNPNDPKKPRHLNKC